jgi:hypothetical protein
MCHRYCCLIAIRCTDVISTPFDVCKMASLYREHREKYIGSRQRVRELLKRGRHIACFPQKLGKTSAKERQG